MPPDDIGDRGQWLFGLLITQTEPPRTEPYFRARFLGDKFPTFDYHVELVGSEAFFFYAQVRATRQGYRQIGGQPHLRVNVSRMDIQRMVASPVPTYAAGIDEPRRSGYLLSLNEPRQSGLGGLPTRHRLDPANLALLWEEVYRYWTSRAVPLTDSRFR